MHIFKGIIEMVKQNAFQNMFEYNMNYVYYFITCVISFIQLINSSFIYIISDTALLCIIVCNEHDGSQNTLIS